MEIEDFTTNEKKEQILNFKIGTKFNSDFCISFATRDEAFYYNFVTNHEYLFFENGYSGIQIEYRDNNFFVEYYHINGKKEGICKIYNDKIKYEENYVNNNIIESKKYINNNLNVHIIKNDNYIIYNEYYDNEILKIKCNKKIIYTFDIKFTEISVSYIGTYLEYFYNGNIKKECNYSDTCVYDGIFKEYYKNGKLFIEKNYKDGKLNGIYKEYYESGSLKLIENYLVNKKYGESIRYFENNNIYSKCIYNNDCLNGKYEEYYYNGNIKLICNYKYVNDDIQKYKHGDIIEYYKSGQINNKGYYIENKLIEYITYDENGEIIREINS